MTGDASVWRAGPDDIDHVAPLFDAYRQFYGLASDPQLSREFLAARLERHESIVFAAGDRRNPIGFTQLDPSFGSLSAAPLLILYDLFVAPSARRRGVGRLLMERAREHALSTGARTIVLSTAVTNSVAQRLYESLGYRRDREFLTYELALP
jgi:ribosomal protein S18 acetylase RimI-like enzyme